MGMSDFDNISDKPEWYVVHTMTGYEKKVMSSLQQIIEKNDLQDKIMEMKMPMITITKKDRSGNDVEVEKPRYPSYIYIKMIMSGDTWHIVRYINGVTSFVGNGARPIPLTQSEIDNLGFNPLPAPTSSYKIGDTVNIKGGMLAGNTGVVAEISEDTKKVKVIVTMFGREMPFEVDAGDIELFGA